MKLGRRVYTQEFWDEVNPPLYLCEAELERMVTSKMVGGLSRVSFTVLLFLYSM